MAADHFFRGRLRGMVDPRHPLAVLARRMPWSEIKATLLPALAHRDRSGATVQGADLFGTNLSVLGSSVCPAA
jgi:IS5 family transposase